MGPTDFDGVIYYQFFRLSSFICHSGSFYPPSSTGCFSGTIFSCHFFITEWRYSRGGSITAWNWLHTRFSGRDYSQRILIALTDWSTHYRRAGGCRWQGLCHSYGPSHPRPYLIIRSCSSSLVNFCSIQEFEIFSPITLTPELLVFPWLPIEGEQAVTYRFKLKAEGTCRTAVLIRKDSC